MKQYKKNDSFYYLILKTNSWIFLILTYICLIFSYLKHDFDMLFFILICVLYMIFRQCEIEVNLLDIKNKMR